MPILDRFKQGVDSAKFKADQMMRVNRVQGEISNLNREISTLREKIANTALELHQGGRLSLPELDELCVSIDRLNAQTVEKEAQIASIRAETPPQAPVASPSAPTPEPAPVTPASPVVAQAPVAPPADIHKCPSCGAELATKVTFCPNCGQRVA